MKQHYYDYEIENKYLEKILFYGYRVGISRKDGKTGIITATAVETGANGKEVLYSATGLSVGEASKNLHIAVLLGSQERQLCKGRSELK